MSRGVLRLEGIRVFDGSEFISADTAVVAPDAGLAVLASSGGAAPRRNATLLPGLVDSHAHVTPGSLRDALRFGVTSQVDLGSSPRWMRRCLRDSALEHGTTRVWTTSFGATVPGGHPEIMRGRHFPEGFPTLDASTGPSRFVQDRMAEGAFCIKVIIEDYATWSLPEVPRVSEDQCRELVTESHRLGAKVVAHATSEAAVRIALDSGVDGLSHMYLDPGATGGDLVRRIVDSGAFVVPTLVLLRGLLGLPGSPLREGASGYRLSEEQAANLARSHGAERPGARRRFEQIRSAVAEMHEAGTLILAGTDAAGLHVPGLVAGYSLHEELKQLRACGLNAAETLRTATSAAAEAWGIPVGALSGGAETDLLLVAGDLEQEWIDFPKIEGVWRSGRRVRC